MLNILLVGGPGSGKGTSANIIKSKIGGHSLVHISTGELFRFHMANDTEIGLQVKEAINAGGLASDDISYNMMNDEVKKQLESPLTNGFIFDGFPRTLEQGPLLEKLLGNLGLELDLVIYLKTTDEIMLNRLSERANRENRPEDRNIEYSTQRIKVFHEQTEPLIEYYQKKKLLYVIDSSVSVDLMAQELDRVVKKVLEGKKKVAQNKVTEFEMRDPREFTIYASPYEASRVKVDKLSVRSFDDEDKLKMLLKLYNMVSSSTEMEKIIKKGLS